METKDLEKLKGSYLERLIEMDAKISAMTQRKTELYGGNGIVDTLREQVIKTYYEGINRKFERMPTLMSAYIDNGSIDVLDAIVDTITDINGYSLMALVDISYHISKGE